MRDLEEFVRKEGLEALAKEAGFLPFTHKYIVGYKKTFFNRHKFVIYIFAFDEPQNYRTAALYKITNNLVKKHEEKNLQLDLKNDLDPLYIGGETIDVLKRFSEGHFYLLL